VPSRRSDRDRDSSRADQSGCWLDGNYRVADRHTSAGGVGADAAGWRPWTDAFVARLRELGWIEGRTVAIEYRWTEGRVFSCIMNFGT